MNNAVGHNAPPWLCIESRAYWSNVRPRDVKETEGNGRPKIIEDNYYEFRAIMDKTGITKDKLAKGRVNGTVRSFFKNGRYYYNLIDAIAYKLQKAKPWSRKAK